MNLLVIIHCSPGSQNARLGWQCVSSALQLGMQVNVFFDGDGVLHAHKPAVLDRGLMNLHQAYNELRDTHPQLSLMVCRAALSRRSELDLANGWQTSGLTAMAMQLSHSARVITFSV